jgi:PAS domain S-box-containing protein
LLVPTVLALFFAALSALAVLYALRERRAKSGERDALLLVRESPDLMCVTRLDGRIRQSNPAWQHTLGYSGEQLADVRLFDLVHAEDRELAVGGVERLHTSPSSSQMILRMVDAGGNHRWVFWTTTTPQSEPAIVWAGKDITAMKEARIHLERFATDLRAENDAMAAQLRQARETSEIKGRLLAQTSHEIRTPMNGVLGMTELLLTTDLNAEQKEYAETIRQSAESLITVLNGMLEYSRLEAKQVEFEPVPFDPAAVAAGVRLLFSARAHQSRVTLTSDLAESVPRSVVGDPQRLRQVLINLVSNAVKFSAGGTVHIGVEAAERQGDRVALRFTVRDSGIGIAPAQLPKLFQPFSQADTSIKRKYGGTGLGLAISKQLVESMGGHMGVDSQLGKGSKFWCVVPFVEADPAKAPAMAAPAAVGEVDPGGAGRNILVVEDNPINQNLARHLLEKEGCQVQVADNGSVAVDAVLGRRFDLVLMDIQMPEMDGITATEMIRRREQPGHRTTIVALTGGGVRADRDVCLGAGMDDFLAKPLTRENLRDLLRRWKPTPERAEAAAVGQ